MADYLRVSIPREDDQWVREYADKNGLSRAAIMRSALDWYRKSPERPAIPAEKVKGTVAFNVASVTREEIAWVHACAEENETTISAVARASVRMARDRIEKGEIVPVTRNPRQKPPKMAPSRAAQERKRKNRPEPRPLPPVVRCDVCGRQARAVDLDGTTIGFHERPARPGDSNYSQEVPTYVICEGAPAVTDTDTEESVTS